MGVDQGHGGAHVRGVNLGNWIVLEKWMGDSPLSAAQAAVEGIAAAMGGKGEVKSLQEYHSTIR